MKSLNGGSVIKCDEIVDTPETVSIGSINKKNNRLSYFSHFFISSHTLIFVHNCCYQLLRDKTSIKTKSQINELIV